MNEKKLYEDEGLEEIPDPDETPIRNRKLVTQPYDLVVSSLIDQIKSGLIHLRPLSEKPKFQRRYVWPVKLASRLIESILTSIPIPPCYLSQNEDFEMDVIDGQQRIFSIHRFIENQFKLSNLEVLSELNGKSFYQLPINLQKKLKTHTLRCVVITNDSHPEIKFDVFERLNTNTSPLNAQELRNCIHRGSLNDLLGELTMYEPWLSILGRSAPDKRLRDEELVLRYFAFHIHGIDSYRTPQKHWLNDAAKAGMKYSPAQIETLRNEWTSTIDKCLELFEPRECFRRLPLEKKTSVINRALMDLVMSTVSKIANVGSAEFRGRFRRLYNNVLHDEEFLDLISKSVDHKRRTTRRFEIWNEKLAQKL